MSDLTRKLRVEFSTRDAFLREYNINLANGGIFVSTLDAFEVNSPVIVELDLKYCETRIEFEGEVVHCISPELSGTGGNAGVAVQISTPVSELREALEPLGGKEVDGDETKIGVGKRGARRSDARAPVELRCEDGTILAGRTRNISDSGMLVSLDGEPLPVGTPVESSLIHPKTGEQVEIDGTVVRHVKAMDGSVMALGIKFQERSTDTEFKNFVGEVRASEHSKKLGGISGAIEELGIHQLLHMFVTYSPQGTLHLRSGEEAGRLLFEGGLVRGARLGERRDAAALAVLLEWEQGSFEFLARADPSEFSDAFALPVDEAIHDAMSSAKEGDASPASEIPSHSLEARLSVLCKVDQTSLAKTEQAIVDLAQVGMTVAKVIEIIPESDADIHRSLQDLMERGVVMLSD